MPSEMTRSSLYGKQFAQLDESPNDANAGLHGHRAIEDAGEHDGAVFGEGIGQSGRKFEGCKVVAICDHLGFFLGRQFEHEVARKATLVAL